MRALHLLASVFVTLSYDAHPQWSGGSPHACLRSGAQGLLRLSCSVGRDDALMRAAWGGDGSTAHVEWRPCHDEEATMPQ